MLSEEEKLKRELREAKAALQHVRKESEHGMDEMFKLETEVEIEVRGDLLHMREETLERRVERLERDLEDLENGWR